jgi:hypothetical protein
VPLFGETDGGHGLPVADAPEEGVPALPWVEAPGVELDGFEGDDDDEPDGFALEPLDVPLSAPGKAPHGDPLGEVPVFGFTVDG